MLSSVQSKFQKVESNRDQTHSFNELNDLKLTLLYSSTDVTSESFCLLTNAKNWYLARMKSALVGLKKKDMHWRGASQHKQKLAEVLFRERPLILESKLKDNLARKYILGNMKIVFKDEELYVLNWISRIGFTSAMFL